MKVILLAAGYGTRLRPITNEMPKCLVPIKGKPLLGYWLEMLFSSGIERILVNTHYFANKVSDYIENSPWKAQVDLAYEDKLLGTAGTLIENQNFYLPEDIMVCHADNLTKFDVKEFIEIHKKRKVGVEITMMTFLTDEPRNCGIVVEDEDGLVVDFYEKVEKPPSNIANAAVYIFSPNVINWLRTLSSSEIDISTQVLPMYLGKIQTYLNTVYHRDIGTPNSLAIAEADFND